jgi:hypothetical protein
MDLNALPEKWVCHFIAGLTCAAEEEGDNEDSPRTSASPGKEDANSSTTATAAATAAVTTRKSKVKQPKPKAKYQLPKDINLKRPETIARRCAMLLQRLHTEGEDILVHNRAHKVSRAFEKIVKDLWTGHYDHAAHPVVAKVEPVKEEVKVEEVKVEEGAPDVEMAAEEGATAAATPVPAPVKLEPAAAGGQVKAEAEATLPPASETSSSEGTPAALPLTVPAPVPIPSALPAQAPASEAAPATAATWAGAAEPQEPMKLENVARFIVDLQAAFDQDVDDAQDQATLTHLVQVLEDLVVDWINFHVEFPVAPDIEQVVLDAKKAKAKKEREEQAAAAAAAAGPAPVKRGKRGAKPPKKGKELIEEDASATATSVITAASRGEAATSHSAAEMDKMEAICNHCLETLMEDPIAAIFSAPVGLDDFPTYLDFVDQPMDLQTVESRLDRGLYRGMTELFITDIRLIWHNCALFNDMKSEIVLASRILSAEFDWMMVHWAGYDLGALNTKFLDPMAGLEEPTKEVLVTEMKYLTKWRGLSFKDCTWEKGKDIDADHMVKRFWEVNHVYTEEARNKYLAMSSTKNLRKREYNVAISTFNLEEERREKALREYKRQKVSVTEEPITYGDVFSNLELKIRSQIMALHCLNVGGAPLLPVPRHILSTSGSDTNLLDEWGIPRIRHLVQADGAVSIPPLPPRIATIVVSRWNRLQKLVEVASHTRTKKTANKAAFPQRVGPQSKNQIGLIGVTHTGGKYRAQIFHKGTMHFLGSHLDMNSAAYAYDAAARLIRGERARCNFPAGDIQSIMATDKLVQEHPLFSKLAQEAQAQAQAASSASIIDQELPEAQRLLKEVLVQKVDTTRVSMSKGEFCQVRDLLAEMVERVLHGFIAQPAPAPIPAPVVASSTSQAQQLPSQQQQTSPMPVGIPFRTEKMWALEIPVGQEGLLMNVVETNNLIKVSGFRRRKDQTAGPAETSGQIRSGDFITHINREEVTGGLKHLVKLLKQARTSDANGNLVHLIFHAPVDKEFPPTARLEDSMLVVRTGGISTPSSTSAAFMPATASVFAAGKSATRNRQSWTGTPVDTAGSFSSLLAHRIAWTGTTKDTRDTWAHTQMAAPTVNLAPVATPAATSGTNDTDMCAAAPAPAPQADVLSTDAATVAGAVVAGAGAVVGAGAKAEPPADAVVAPAAPAQVSAEAAKEFVAKDDVAMDTTSSSSAAPAPTPPPTVAATATLTAEATAIAISTPTAEATATATPTAEATATPAAEAKPTPTVVPTPAPTVVPTPTQTAEATPTPTIVSTSDLTVVPTSTPTPTPPTPSTALMVLPGVPLNLPQQLRYKAAMEQTFVINPSIDTEIAQRYKTMAAVEDGGAALSHSRLFSIMSSYCIPEHVATTKVPACADVNKLWEELEDHDDDENASGGPVDVVAYVDPLPERILVDDRMLVEIPRNEGGFVPHTKSPVYCGGRELRSYQVDGLNWLVKCWQMGRSCILADEMGLGKTIQTLAYLEHLKNKNYVRGPHLIVAPLSTIENWRRETEDWTNQNICVYLDPGGGKDGREMIRRHLWNYREDQKRATSRFRPNHFKFHILLTTFETLLVDADELQSIRWKTLIVDEAHRLKNSQSKIMQMMKTFDTEHRVLLTGTPLQVIILCQFNMTVFDGGPRCCLYWHLLLGYTKQNVFLGMPKAKSFISVFLHLSSPHLFVLVLSSSFILTSCFCVWS